MKKSLITLILSSAMLSASAETYYWNFHAGWLANWNENFTKPNGSDGNPGSGDDVIFQCKGYFNEPYNTGTATSQPYFVGETKAVNSLTFKDLYYTKDVDGVATDVAQSITMTGSKIGENGSATSQTFSVINDFTYVLGVKKANVYIGGNGATNRKQFYFTIGGNLNMNPVTDAAYDSTLYMGNNETNGYLDKLTIGGNLNFNGGQLIFNVGSGSSSTMDNPDVDIAGVVNYNTSGSWSLNNKSGTGTGNTYIRVGGLNTMAGGSKISNGTSATFNSNTYLVFNVGSGQLYNYAGWICEWNTGSSLHLVMNGEGSQNIYETSAEGGSSIAQFMRGGIQVINGTLQAGSAFGRYQKVELFGGRFSAFGADKNDIGTIKIKDLEWTDGTLLVNVDADGNSDYFDISGNFTKIGEEGQKFLVEIDAAVAFEGKALKIAQWEGTSNFSADDFISTITTDEAVSFEIRNGNELWAVIGVPEPATFAALLGAFALGFAAYRRRK